MTTPDDYGDEMRRLNRLTERDIDRLFDGRAPAEDETLEDLAVHLRGLKATARLQVPEEVASAQITAILSAHRLVEKGESVARPTSKAHGPDRRVSGLPKPTRRVSMRKRLVLLTAKIGAVFVGASMLTVGMAFAGVTLPDAVNDAFDRAGVTLPNQASDALLNAQGRPEDLPGQPEIEGEGSETSQAVLSVIDTWEGERDCFFGLAVASAATGEEKDTSPCTASENGDLTEAQGSKATGDANSAEGRSKATTAGGNASTDAEGSQETGTTKSGGRSTSGSDNAPTGSGSQGGSDTGSDASSEGQSKRDEAPRPQNGGTEEEE